MPGKVFVSLPVADVAAASAFYAAIGFVRNDLFSNGQASAMEWSSAMSVMLLDHATFATLTAKRIIDPRVETGALHALSFDSRAEVDAVTDAALAAGGRELHGPEDLGFMYSRAFEDPDGHGWGPMHIDAGAFAATTQTEAA